MSSKDLAETIIRAEKISNLAKQLNNVDFCISNEKKDKIYIKNGEGKVDKQAPILDLSGVEIPKELVEDIGLEKICTILNDQLERAKFKILKQMQISIFKELDFDEPEEDDFILVK